LPYLTSRAKSEHWYFSVAAVTVTLTVLAGFAPLYTLRLLGHDPNLTLLVHAQDFVMAAWIALFLTQTLLIANHRVDLRRRLGRFGAGRTVGAYGKRPDSSQHRSPQIAQRTQRSVSMDAGCIRRHCRRHTLCGLFFGKIGFYLAG
jgi:hypothetical protein